MELKLWRWILLTCILFVSACGAPPQPVLPIQAQDTTPAESEQASASEPEYDLAKITAERRAAGKPDPIRILIDLPEEPLVGSPVHLPDLKISLKNDDAETTFQVQPVDNYRSGRLPKFRIVIRDEQGKEFPPRPRFSSTLGGILHAYRLAPGETWDTTLNLRGYVNPLPPGNYRLQVLFSDRASIVEMEDISDVVCCQSKTIDFVVRKLPVKISDVDAAVVRAQIAALDGDAPLRIVAGTYGPWAYGFIAKNSPAGQLLAIGPTAVPQLVEAAQDKTLTPGKRAWLLAILFSLTSRNDPRGDDMFQLDGCLESYEYVVGPWSIAAGKDDQEEPVTYALASTGSRNSPAALDPKKLDEHAARWPAWLKENCDLEVAP